MGLQSRHEMEDFDREFTERLGARQSIPEIVEWFRRSGSNPIASLTVALFTQDPDLRLA